MNEQLKDVLRSLLRHLVAVRCSGSGAVPDMHRWGVYGMTQGEIRTLEALGLITGDQADLLSQLLSNACKHSSKPFLSVSNVGPVMPRWVAFERSQPPVKLQAQVLPNEPEQVSAPAAPRPLRLLCLLVPTRDGQARSLPVHTMRPMPPRLCAADTHSTYGQNRWDLDDPRVGVAGETGLYLRETQARRPAAEVLERCARQRQAHSVCATARTVSTRGVSHAA